MTSSQPTATLAAFSAELRKIAEAAANSTKKPTLKKWIKNTLVIGAGYGAGHGAAMIGSRALEHALGDRWRNWSTPTKRMILGPALGIAGAGATLAHHNLAAKRYKADHE